VTTSSNGDGVGTQAEYITFWNQILNPYVKSDGIFVCPSNPRAWVNADKDNVGETEPAFRGYGGNNSYGCNNYVFPTENSPVGGEAGTGSGAAKSDQGLAYAELKALQTFMLSSRAATTSTARWRSHAANRCEHHQF
jgi:hypothetical protein